jgi:ABC-type amino acid transport substrate-binding protein
MNTGSGTVRVGYNPEFAPFTHVEHGEASGLLADRIRQIFAAANLPLQFTPVPMPRLLEELASDGIDMVAALASVPGRRETLALSRPIAISGGAWFTPVDSRWPGNDELLGEAALGLRVITPGRGPLVDLIREQYPRLSVQTCGDYRDALRAVSAGEAHAAALNREVGACLCQRDYPGRFRQPVSSFCRLPLVMAAPPGDPLDLLARLNPHIRAGWGREELRSGT